MVKRDPVEPALSYKHLRHWLIDSFGQSSFSCKSSKHHNSQFVRARELIFVHIFHHQTCVRCHISHVICLVSCVRCDMSCVRCHMYFFFFFLSFLFQPFIFFCPFLQATISYLKLRILIKMLKLFFSSKPCLCLCIVLLYLFIFLLIYDLQTSQKIFFLYVRAEMFFFSKYSQYLI